MIAAGPLALGADLGHHALGEIAGRVVAEDPALDGADLPEPGDAAGLAVNGGHVDGLLAVAFGLDAQAGQDLDSGDGHFPVSAADDGPGRL